MIRPSRRQGLSPGGALSDERLADLVRQRMDAGVLPRVRHDKRWIAYGYGYPCDACGDKILAVHVEHELFFPDGRRIRLHVGCAALYEAMLDQERRQASG